MTRELLQQALDALRQCEFTSPPAQRPIVKDAITALRSALAAPMPEPVAWPALVAETVLDTPEPDKWIDCGEARPLPMFHMHTLILYGEKCAESGITHGVKTAPPAAPAPVVQCPTCNGDDMQAPCAYPEGGQPGCLRDKRLSAAPVVREPLTDEQIDRIRLETREWHILGYLTAIRFARAIEAHHGIGEAAND